MIANGEEPPVELSAPEALAQRLTSAAIGHSPRRRGALPRSRNTFGAYGLIDIAFLIGIYHSVCATLTMFAIPTPEQADIHEAHPR